MLKHATINRTSRAQQTLQLQRQCQLNQVQSQQPAPSATATAADQLDGPMAAAAAADGDRLEFLPNLFPHSPTIDCATQFQSLADQHLHHHQEVEEEEEEDNNSYQLPPRSSHTSSPFEVTASPSPIPSLLSTPTHRSQRLTSTSSLLSSPSSFTATAAAVADTYNYPTQLRASPNHQQYRAQCDSSSTIKVFAQTLSQDVAYITVPATAQTKSNQIVKNLLKKFRLKHRDPNLFYLTLERWMRKDGLKYRSVMCLGDEACPLQLQQCCSNPPHDDIKFTLLARTGSLVKIFCSDVVPNACYKYLSLSTQTTVEETIELMLHCLNLATPVATTNSSSRLDSNSYTTSTSTTATTTKLTSYPHHRTQLSGNSDSTSSSSDSPDSCSTSSGIESEPNNNNSNNCTQNGHSSLPIFGNSSNNHNNGPDLMDSSIAHQRILQRNASSSSPVLDSHSRTSSVTSISSTSNISNISNSVTDQYCMIIECIDTNYKRVLEHDEYLVDVYQNLILEAKGQSANSPQCLDVANSNRTEPSGPIKQQQPDQWFHIKLKRRSDCNQTTIKFTSPRQNVPLPPIPLSLAQQFHTATNLQHIVSMTQIEVNRRPNYPYTNGCPADSKAGNNDLFSEHKCLDSNQKQITANTTTTTTTGTRPRAPPPPEFITLPPVRPRRRNLSSASSTFGRPLMANRRRYDPAQLAEDLNKLNVREVINENNTCHNGAGQLLVVDDK